MIKTYSDTEDHYAEWVFIAPIAGLNLTKAVSNEYTVLNITFVEKSKLVRIGQRLGSKLRSEEIKKQITLHTT